MNDNNQYKVGQLIIWQLKHEKYLGLVAGISTEWISGESKPMIKIKWVDKSIQHTSWYSLYPYLQERIKVVV